MDISKLSCIIILFVFISFTVADEEIKTAVVNNENKLKLECEEDSKIHILVSKSFWTDDFNASCPDRSFWNTFNVNLMVYLSCNDKQNCSVDLTNTTITNCIDYKNFLNVKYMCNITETTTTEGRRRRPTKITTTMSSTELSTESSTERTLLPSRKLLPNYHPVHLPALLTTKKPSINFGPSLRQPEPIILPNYNNYGRFNIPIILPLPLPLPAPIPLFG